MAFRIASAKVDIFIPGAGEQEGDNWPGGRNLSGEKLRGQHCPTDSIRAQVIPRLNPVRVAPIKMSNPNGFFEHTDVIPLTYQ